GGPGRWNWRTVSGSRGSSERMGVGIQSSSWLTTDLSSVALGRSSGYSRGNWSENSLSAPVRAGITQTDVHPDQRPWAPRRRRRPRHERAHSGDGDDPATYGRSGLAMEGLGL